MSGSLHIVGRKKAWVKINFSEATKLVSCCMSIQCVIVQVASVYSVRSQNQVMQYQSALRSSLEVENSRNLGNIVYMSVTVTWKVHMKSIGCQRKYHPTEKRIQCFTARSTNSIEVSF